MIRMEDRKKKCPDCGTEMIYIPKNSCSISGCKNVSWVWICMECGKEIEENEK